MSDLVLIQGYSSLVPLIRTLEADARFSVAIFDNYAKIPTESLPTLEPFMVEGFDAARPRVRDVVDQMGQALRRPEFQGQFQYQGQTFWNQIGEEFAAELTRAVTTSIAVIEGFRRFWLKHRPRLVVMANDVMVHTKTLTRAAQQLGVPVLHVAHGSPPSDLHPHVFADRIALYGPRDRDWYAARGNDQEKLIVTGAAIYDYVPAFLRTFDRAASETAMGLEPGRRRIAFLSTWPHQFSLRAVPSHIEAAYRATARACKELGDVELLVKPHPATPNSTDFYQNIAREEGMTCRVIEDRLPEVIGVSDVALCFDSNSGVEAMLLGKPVIALRFPPWHAELFETSDAALIVRNPQELRKALGDALENHDLQTELKRRRDTLSIPRFNGPNDGQAASRIRQLMADMAAERKDFPLTMVVRTHNQLPQLQEMLQKWPAEEWLIVDAHSTDGTRPWLEQQGIPWISEDADVLAQWSTVEAQTAGEWLLYADGPILPVRGAWQLLRTLLADEQVAGVAPQVMSARGWAGIGPFWAGEWRAFGNGLPPDSPQAASHWRLSGAVGRVVLRRRGQSGSRVVYSPDLRVLTLGWEPDHLWAPGKKMAPSPGE